MAQLSHTACPVCSHPKMDPHLEVKDHSISGEQFSIRVCQNCGVWLTTPYPDAEHIGAYYESPDYVSHNNEAKGLINTLYKTARSYMLGRKAAWVERYVAGRGRALDYGAGVGAFAHTLQKRGWEVTGLEPNAQARQQARNAHGLELQPIEHLASLETGQFQLITMWHVLEHIHDLQGTMAELRRVLAEDGLLAIAVPNPESTDSRIYGPYWAGLDVPRHLYHFPPPVVERLAFQQQLTLVGRRAMPLDSFYVALLSERYKSGKTRWVRGLATGLHSYVRALQDVTLASSLVYFCMPGD